MQSPVWPSTPGRFHHEPLSRLSPRPFNGKVEARSQEADGKHARSDSLAQIVPPKGKACVDHPKNSKAEPDGCGAHLEENSTTKCFVCRLCVLSLRQRRLPFAGSGPPRLDRFSRVEMLRA